MDPTELDPNDLEATEEHHNPTPPRGPWIAVAASVALLVISLGFNAGLWRSLSQERNRPPPTPAPVATPTCPPPPECPAPQPAPTCPECPTCAPEPTPTTATTTAHTGPRTPPPPRVDTAAAQEGETHVATATSHGEHDPVNLTAQRRVISGVDRIADSHSPEAAERFLARNLPGIASMDCAFRDPALAEHVRMRLRELNQTARPDHRLSEADLARYERDLRCPRE